VTNWEIALDCTCTNTHRCLRRIRHYNTMCILWARAVLSRIPDHACARGHARHDDEAGRGRHGLHVDWSDVHDYDGDGDRDHRDRSDCRYEDGYCCDRDDHGDCVDDHDRNDVPYSDVDFQYVYVVFCVRHLACGHGNCRQYDDDACSFSFCIFCDYGLNHALLLLPRLGNPYHVLNVDDLNHDGDDLHQV